MNTYKVMMVNEMGAAKVSIIVASSEDQAMQFANLAKSRVADFVAKFALKMFAGSVAD